MGETITLILAAGKGTRMKSRKAKVLHPLMGVPMLSFPIQIAKKINSKKIIVVIGHQGRQVESTFDGEGLVFVNQKEQLGTGHAVLCAKEEIGDFDGNLLILCGDVPLIKEETVKKLIEFHQKERSSVTVLTTKLDTPKGYGRMIRDEGGRIVRIVEEKDASDDEKEVKEINTGIYCMESEYAFQALEMVEKENKQGEYYLTDVIDIAFQRKKKLTGFLGDEPLDYLGINDRVDLACVCEVMRDRILKRLMVEGVTIFDPKATYIEADVTIGRDTIIYPNNYIKRGTSIGDECIIEQGCTIDNSRIGNRVVVKSCSVIHDSILHDEVTTGPFIHLGPDAELHKNEIMGDFMALKGSRIQQKK